MIEEYEKRTKKQLISELLTSYPFMISEWVKTQPKDKVFQFGGCSANPKDSTMVLIEKTIDELNEGEKKIQFQIDLYNNYKFSE